MKYLVLPLFLLCTLLGTTSCSSDNKDNTEESINDKTTMTSDQIDEQLALYESYVTKCEGYIADMEEGDISAKSAISEYSNKTSDIRNKLTEVEDQMSLEQQKTFTDLNASMSRIKELAATIERKAIEKEYAINTSDNSYNEPSDLSNNPNQTDQEDEIDQTPKKSSVDEVLEAYNKAADIIETATTNTAGKAVSKAVNAVKEADINDAKEAINTVKDIYNKIK